MYKNNNCNEEKPMCSEECNRYYFVSTTAGSPTGILDYADFYALMPGDNTATIAPGTDVSFPQDGPNKELSITRISDTSFNL